MCIEVIVCYIIVVFFETRCITSCLILAHLPQGIHKTNITTQSEEDRAMAIGNMHKNLLFVKVQHVVFEFCKQLDRQTNRHAHHNTSHPSQGWSNKEWYRSTEAWCVCRSDPPTAYTRQSSAATPTRLRATVMSAHRDQQLDRGSKQSTAGESCAASGELFRPPTT